MYQLLNLSWFQINFIFSSFMLNEYGSAMETHMLSIEDLLSEPVVVDTDDVDDLFG